MSLKWRIFNKNRISMFWVEEEKLKKPALIVVVISKD
jgi:hypothetical protein